MISYSEKMFLFPVWEHKLWIFLLPFHTTLYRIQGHCTLHKSVCEKVKG